MTVGLLYLAFVPGTIRRIYQYRYFQKPMGFSMVPSQAYFKVGDKFPELKLKSAGGESFRFSAHPHKVLLVNYFASW